MIRRLVKLKLKEEGVAAFAAIFDTSKEKIRASKGCHHVEYWQCVEDPTTVFTYSIWDSTEDLDAYRKSETFGQIWPQLKLLFDGSPEAWSTKKLNGTDE